MFKKIIVFSLLSLLSIACRASSARQSGSPNEASMKTSAQESSQKVVWQTADGSALDQDCRDLLEHKFSLLPVQLVSVEQRKLSRSAFPSLRLEGGDNDAVSVKGWDQPEISLKACKMAAAKTKEQALQVLNGISVLAENGKISSGGPTAEGFWGVQFVLYVPRDLGLDLSTHNGDIRLSNLAGEINARTENGGVTLNETRGRVKAETGNGGIDIRLPEGKLQGEGLEAKSGNGSLKLEVPSGFSSTIEAETLGRTAIECLVKGCVTQDSDRDRKRVRIGDSGPPLVRVSTGNGDLRIIPAR